MGKVKDPGVGNKIIVTVIGSQGKCNAGHVLGDQFELSVHNPDGLCGFFYYNLSPGSPSCNSTESILGGLRDKPYLKRNAQTGRI